MAPPLQSVKPTAAERERTGRRALWPHLLIGALAVAVFVILRRLEYPGSLLPHIAAAFTFLLGQFFYRYGFKQGMFVVVANLIGLVLCAGAAELLGQFYVRLRPAYDVLYVQPDPDLGWKQVPGLSYTWAGWGIYAKEFSVPVQINSLGFRDVERQTAKPPGVVRIALLGDSMVEAIQVPFDKTAGQLLEKRLNGLTSPPYPLSKAPRKKPTQYEVLNFGTSSFSTGQCLLAWERHVRNFSPDLVFLLAADFIWNREPDAEGEGVAQKYSEEDVKFRVRPSFSLEGDQLVRGTVDYDRFVEVQQRVIEKEFGGERMRRRKVPGLMLRHWLDTFLESDFYRKVRALPAFDSDYHRFLRERRMAPSPSAFQEFLNTVEWPFDAPPVLEEDEDEEEVAAVNLKIIEELGEQIAAAGGRLVVVNYGVAASAKLERLCAERDIGYLPLQQYLLFAEYQGQPMHWPVDGHFNEEGNMVFAEAMYHRLKTLTTRAAASP